MASQAELEWWNKFADIMAEQWMLTPAMNAMIRKEYEAEYESYLFLRDGSFLEIGCGTGWIGHKFAARGMQVDGIDFSEGQLGIARRLATKKGLTNVAYFARDLVNDSLKGRFERYDAVLVNAVLHHLSESEIELLVGRISQLLAPGGRLYLYEPLAPQRESLGKQMLMWPADIAVRGVLFTIARIGKLFRLFKQNFADAMRDGYTGTSPDEKPIPAETLRAAFSRHGLIIAGERPFHNYSLAIAMSIVRLRPRIVEWLTPAIPLFYRLDAWLFRLVGWQNLGDDRAILCGMKIAKPTGASAAG